MPFYYSMYVVHFIAMAFNQIMFVAHGFWAGQLSILQLVHGLVNGVWPVWFVSGFST